MLLSRVVAVLLAGCLAIVGANVLVFDAMGSEAAKSGTTGYASQVT